MTVYRVFVPDNSEDDEPDIPCPKDESDVIGLDNEQWSVEISPEDAKQ